MIYDNLFSTDLEKVAIQLLPIHWRKPIHIAFLKLLAYPFKRQLAELSAQREINIYRLTHDSRVGLLEKVLNDRFDTTGRTIKIGPGNRIASLYLYTAAEASETYLPKTVYTQTEIAERNTDFLVLVPESLSLPDQELEVLKFLTKYYTGKDKQFKIEII